MRPRRLRFEPGVEESCEGVASPDIRHFREDIGVVEDKKNPLLLRLSYPQQTIQHFFLLLQARLNLIEGFSLYAQ